MELKNKIVLITGSSQGIGCETAKAFAKKGAKVIVTYNKTKKGGDEVLRECKKHSDAMLLKLDVLDDKSITHVVKEIKNKFGKLDLLINNAGVFLHKPFETYSFNDIKREIDTNLSGPIKLTNALLSLMKGQAIIINVASVLSKQPYGQAVVYCATKAGLRMFTQSLKLALSPKIKTFTINPGLTSTRMTKFEGVPPEKVANIIIKTAEEKLNKKTGDDIDVPDYL